MRTETSENPTRSQASSGHVEQCIENCLSCSRSCLETIPHCLELGGKHASPEHISLLLNCAEICDTSAKFMISCSPHHARTCEVCAEVCEQCAQECGQMGSDEQMQACADACQKCAESCTAMASH